MKKLTDKCLILLLVINGLGQAEAQDVFRGNWNPSLTESGVPNLGGVLYPHVHARTAVGSSTNAAELAGGAHDPQENGFNLQGIELGASLRQGDHVRAFVTSNIFWDDESGWEAEMEEAFLKLVRLPGGFEIRGGRFFNRISFENAVHLHGWRFVDQNLVVGRFLGEEGLITEGLELAWNLPINNPTLTSQVGLSYGSVAEHEEHGHSGAHAGHGGEESLFNGQVISIYSLTRWQPDDFHTWNFLAGAAFGDNEYGRSSQLLHGGASFEWRENGLEPGGQSLRVMLEGVVRRVRGDENAIRFDQADSGIHAMLNYGFGENWEGSLRYGWLQGEESLETDERKRLSLAMTKALFFGSSSRAQARVQVNNDWIDGGNEQSVWLQLGFDWGGPEVR